MAQRITPRKITNSFYHIRDSVKPMRCVDLIAESKEAKGPSKPFTSCYVSGFLKDFKKNLNRLWTKVNLSYKQPRFFWKTMGGFAPLEREGPVRRLLTLEFHSCKGWP